MANKEFLKETLEHYKQQKQAKLAELHLLDITIRQLQVDLGEPADQVDFSFSASAVGEAKVPIPPPQTKFNVDYKPRVDEFFGMAIAEAARTYLDKIGHAVLIEDIFKAITGGGCRVGGADPKRTLAITLAQGKREFVATGGGNFGLRKFYPNMPKLGRPEGSAPSKKAGRGTKKSSKRNAKEKTSAEPAKAKPYDRETLTAAINEALGDHKAKTADEVLAAVERRIGHSVKKIAVYGTLRKKDFEQVGDKYRLRQLGDLPVPEVVQ